MSILNAPSHITSLATSAVLIDLRMSLYTGRKSDDAMSDKVSANEGANERVLSITHDLFAKNADLRNIHTYRQRIYNWSKAQTYDWAGELRLLPTYKLMDYMKGAEAHRTEFYRLVEVFVGKLEEIIANAAFARGPLFKREDYPSADELRGRFRMSFNILEVNTGDFRVQVANDLAADLKAQFESQAQEFVNSIATKQADTLVSLMKSISHCCELDQVMQGDGTVKIERRRLHEATIQKALAMCDEIGQFNIAGSNVLDEARRELHASLGHINIDALRISDSLRAKVKTEVDQILSKF